MKRILMLLFALLVCVSLVACEEQEAIKGEKGDAGEQGVQGEKGDAGEQGVQGDKGDAGEQGVQGEKGDKGDTGAQGEQGIQGESGRGILKTEIIDGYLWITYTDAPDTPVNVGKITEDAPKDEGTTDLDFFPLDDGTYAVSVGNAKYLSNIVIPATYKGKPVSTIIEGAFENCTLLESITIPSTVTCTKNYAFLNCRSLKKVYFEGTVEQWCAIEFGGYMPLCYFADLYIKGELLTDLVIPASVTKIGKYAFAECNSLTSVFIPSSVTEIEPDAFKCPSLTRVYCEAEIRPSGWKTGFGTSNCVVYWGVKAFGETESGIFWVQSQNDEITIAGCSKAATSATIPSEIKSLPVTSIGNSAFQGCTALTSVVIPNSVTSIESNAFSGCASLTSVVIPNGVETIGSSAFQGCTSLASITVDTSNESYQSIDGNLYTKDGKTLVQYAIGKKDTSFEIPSSVTSIGNGAFEGCATLTSIVIPDSVISIGNSAFYDCIALTSIVIPDSVTSIGIGAFYNCVALTSVVIPNIPMILPNTFYCCESLTSVFIPSSVTSIGSLAFYGCPSLTIYCEAESKPSGWGSGWNNSNYPVVWGHTHSYTGGECVCGKTE